VIGQGKETKTSTDYLAYNSTATRRFKRIQIHLCARNGVCVIHGERDKSWTRTNQISTQETPGLYIYVYAVYGVTVRITQSVSPPVYEDIHA